MTKKVSAEAFLNASYTRIVNRLNGRATNRPYLYEGHTACGQYEFISWAKRNKDFQFLFKQWKNYSYDKSLTPSVDRIDATEGYIENNMRWITASHNYSLGAANEVIMLDNKQVKPLLAAKVEDTAKLRYPVYVSPKLDGIRCLVINGKAVTRKLKPIPNDYIRAQLEEQFKDINVDGELMVPGMDFNGVQGEVMRKTGKPQYTYTVFDIIDPELPYEQRRKKLTDKRIAYPLFGTLVHNEQFLLMTEQEYLNLGYEGLMIRSPEGRYKYGRSGVKEGILLKLKRFNDSEARVVGFEERMHNANEAKKDALGHTERSSAKAGLIGTNTLGSLVVYDPTLDVQFSIGTGFDDEYRDLIWAHQKKYMGKLVTYTYQELSKYGVPRFPVFKGFRSEDDVSE